MKVVIRRAGEAEVDEMWSYVRRKTEPRWLWHAIDHRSGKVLAYLAVARMRFFFEAQSVTGAFWWCTLRLRILF